MNNFVSTAASARAAGDAARDRREWSQAVSFYQYYLDNNAHDAPIWVQLGHSLKESSRFKEAETAYRRALSLIPDDPDLHLQLGHLQKLLGWKEQANHSYATSMRLSPTKTAYKELIGLGQSRLARRLLLSNEPQFEPRHTYIQITDFFNYLIAHKTVSGIQRVQLGIINYVLEMPPGLSKHHTFVYTEGTSPQLWALQVDQLRDVAGYIGGAEVEHDLLKRRIAAAIDGAKAVKLQLGDTCVIAGSFWGVDSVVDLLRECQKQGVYSAVYFYDLLPVTHPEFFDAALASSFRQGLFHVLMLIDFGLCISEFTAQEVRRFTTENGLRAVPVRAVTLAHSFRDVASAVDETISADQPWSSAIARLRGRPFVLCVCTIEIRKNHRYLFDAWKALLAEGEPMPDLVLVGRPGWRVGDLMSQLETTRYLQGRIHIVHDLSDSELATLYRHCLFTVFPSFAEGWGLPIGESLSYGKLCVASNTSSMPEVGGDLVEYIDPMNLRDGIETLRRIVRTPACIEEREAAIRARFRPRLWTQVGADLISAVDRFVEEVGIKRPNSVVPTLEANRALSLSSDDYNPTEPMQQVLRLALTGGWFAQENMGIWMDGSFGGLEFNTPFAPGEPTVMFLRFGVVPWADNNELEVIDTTGSGISITLVPGRSLTFRFKTRVRLDGRVVISLRVKGQVFSHGTDTRHICVSLARFGISAERDGLGRLQLLEQILAE